MDDMASDERLGKLQDDGVLGECFGFNYDDERDAETFTAAVKQDLDLLNRAVAFAAGICVGAVGIILAAYFFYGGY